MSTTLPCIRPNAAGIDIGSRSHFVAVPQGRAEETIKEFSFFTEDLYRLSAWLKSCKIETVAIEATGSYWIPLYDILEKDGFEVYLVNSRDVKNVSGRKSDVKDCQWLQQLHSYGLLQKSFIPDALTKEVRHLVRHRDSLIGSSSEQIQLMQKALIEMNMPLQNVLSCISSDTGMSIIQAIVDEERNSKVLAQHRDPRCKSSVETIEKSLCGHYKATSLFTLKQALSTYQHYSSQIKECDEQIAVQMQNSQM